MTQNHATAAKKRAQTERSQTGMSQEAWLDGLRAEVSRWHGLHPLADVADGSPQLQALVEVQGTGFAEFVQEQAPLLIAEREEAARRGRQDPSEGSSPPAPPALIWITDDPGLQAADLMLTPDATHLLAVPEAVFDAWMEAEPDWACRFHLEYIATFAPLSSAEEAQLTTDQQAIAAQTPDGTWLMHQVGMIWGDGDGHETRHLWRWHDARLQLVQPSWGGAVIL